MSEPKEPKDIWDKLEVTGKILVPVLVAGTILWWNGQRTTQQMATAMTEIALGVLAEEPKANGEDALRYWAIEVLQSPRNPPALSQPAAEALRNEPLPLGAMAEALSAVGWVGLVGGDGFGGYRPKQPHFLDPADEGTITPY